jgi:hypothetical protein
MNAIPENRSSQNVVVFLTKNRGLAVLGHHKGSPIITVFEPSQLSTENDPITSAAACFHGIGWRTTATDRLLIGIYKMVYVTLKGEIYIQCFYLNEVFHLENARRKLTVITEVAGPYRAFCTEFLELTITDSENNTYELHRVPGEEDITEIRRKIVFPEDGVTAFKIPTEIKPSKKEVIFHRDSINEAIMIRHMKHDPFDDYIVSSEQEAIELLSSPMSKKPKTYVIVFTDGRFEIWEKRGQKIYNKQQDENCIPVLCRGKVCHITCTKTNYYVIFELGDMYIGDYDDPHKNTFVQNTKFLTPCRRDQPNHAKWRTVFKWLFMGRLDINSIFCYLPVEVVYNCAKVY